MARWPVHPMIYEVNTWVWLEEIGRKHMRPITLATVPGNEWDRIAEMRIDAVWLMGVWERSPIGAQVMRNNSGLCRYAENILADFTPDDIVGSPYCVRQYVPDERLGGFEGLKRAREELRTRGLKLVLDYVPNHVAPDHPWVDRHPNFLCRVTQATSSVARQNSSKSQGRSWLLGVTHTSLRGQTWCSSIRSGPGCVPRALTCCRRSLSAATACGVTWPCCS